MVAERGMFAQPDPDDGRLEAALSRLSPDERRVVHLRITCNLSFRDIAQHTGEPLASVLATHRRAMHALQAALDD